MDNINRHVVRLRQLAVAAKAAGDAEEYAMDAGNEGEAPARDPASLQRVELVQRTSVEVERITPQLITAAQVCVAQLTTTLQKSGRNQEKRIGRELNFVFVSLYYHMCKGLM